MRSRALGALVLLLAACSPGVELTMTGSQAASGTLAITGGGEISHPDHDVSLYFGTVSAEGIARRFSYFLVVRPGTWSDLGEGWDVTRSSQTSTDGHVARDEFALDVGGRTLTVLFTAEADEAGTGLVQSLVVNGVERDVAEGRVFLVDFHEAPPTIRQLDSPLQTTLPTAWTPEVVQGAGLDALRGLLRESEELRDFAR